MYSQILAPALLMASAVSAVPTSPSMYTNKTGKAIYMLGNNFDKNSVIAVPIGPDGMLSGGTSTMTSGMGGAAVDAEGNPDNPDALASQQALTVAGDYVFAVNAGSNSVSMFAIDKWDATKLTMVGKPAVIPGEFPNTVAASAKNGLVCAAATGAVAGISCAPFSAHSGIGEMDALRPIELDPQQTTPPLGPTNTVSQVFFSDDEKTLYATVKGNGMDTTGFFGAWPVKRACSPGKTASVAAEGIMSTPETSMVLFGSEPIPGTNDIFVTDASYGAAVLTVDPKTHEATLKANQTIEGQAATCWAALSPITNSAFVFDVAVNRIVEMSLADASIMSTLDLSMVNNDPGLLDARAVGNYLYALSPGNGTTESSVTVVDLTKMEQVQKFGIEKLGGSKFTMGMATMMW